MLGKLSIRNAKRQAKDYGIYFITIILAVSLMFSFNSIAVSEDISQLSSGMKPFSKAITGISVIIVFIMGWLIHYTMRFMLEKRSKEFGIYEILGMEKKDISQMFTFENMIIGLLAFTVGIMGGVLLYQVLTSIIMNLFQQPYAIQIVFDLEAVGITAVYFFGIFLFVLLKSRRKIKKTKVYDLLYADKKNENNVIKKTRGSYVVFLLSIVLIILAYWINDHEFKSIGHMAEANVFLAIILLIIGIYLFYMSVSSFLVKRYLENKKRKYQHNHLFFYRNLTSKINTMSITMGTIALMFTIILIGGNVALLMNNMLNNEVNMGYPFEIMITTTDGDFTKYKEYIENNSTITRMHEYRLYRTPATPIAKEAFSGTAFGSRSCMEYEHIMLLSDYNRIREILGYESVSLKDDEVILNCLETAESFLEDYVERNDSIQIAGQEKKIREVRDENIGQIGFNGYYYMIIVKDDLKDVLLEEEKECKDSMYYYDLGYKLVVQTEETTDEKFWQDLTNLIKTEEREIESGDPEVESYRASVELGQVLTKGERTSQTKSFYAMISFLSFYVALVFVMGAATMLAIQILSDSEKYKYRYELLRKLGMDELEINRTILKQVFYYFFLPMILPFIISIPIMISVSHAFTIAVTIHEIFWNIGIIYGMFLLVYGIYFIATDMQFIRNIEEGR